MNTEIVEVDPCSPDATIIGRAADLIRAGRLVAFPTETVYGLGANALDARAVRHIFEAKGRPASNPLIVHVAEPSHVVNVAREWPETAVRLARRFWPGPLTLILPRGPSVPDEVTAGGPTVAIRCPAHPVARALVREAGVPIAGPSANRSTELSPTRAEHVWNALEGRVDLILDAGPCPGGIESTVVDATGEVVRLLRPGPITVPMLEEVVGTVGAAAAQTGPARSPGQMARHYSPRTRVVLVGRNAPLDDAIRAQVLRRFDRLVEIEFSGPVARGNDLSHNPAVAAAHLYDALHRLDREGHEAILVNMPPDTPEWAAVRDRITRAACTDEDAD